MGKGLAFSLGVVLISQDLLQLIELEVNNLLSHGVSDTITIDEDVVGELSSIEVSVGLKGTTEVLLKNVWGNNFLALLSLRTGLSVVLAKEGVVGCDETNDTLLSLVANVDTDKHGLGWDVFAEVHSPEITSEFGIDLSDNVQVDAVVIPVDRLASDELRDNGVVRVYFIFDGGIEVLLS